MQLVYSTFVGLVMGWLVGGCAGVITASAPGPTALEQRLRAPLVDAPFRDVTRFGDDMVVMQVMGEWCAHAYRTRELKLANVYGSGCCPFPDAPSHFPEGMM